MGVSGIKIVNDRGAYKVMREQRKERFAIWCSVAMIIFMEAAWTYLWQYTDIIRGNLGILLNYDVMYYVSSIILAFLLFPIVFTFLSKEKICLVSTDDNRIREIIFCVISAVLILIAYACIFLFEKKQPYVFSAYLPWHNSRKAEYLVLCLSVIIMLISYIALKNSVKQKAGKCMKLFWFFMSVWAAWGVYQPNCFNEMYDTVHVNAYFNSVYRVLYLHPFTEIDGGVYGFYGIILAPLVKVLGGDVVACMVALAVLTALSMLCYYYVLDSLVNYTWIKVVASVAMLMGIVVTISEIRVQRFPHRIIFAGFLLAYIVYANKRSKNKMIADVIGNILVILSLVWNFETGIGCLAAWVGYKVVGHLQTYKLNEKELWYCVLKQMCIAIFDLIGAFVLVGAYNLFVGGEFITVEAFLFPFVGSGMVEMLNVELPLIPSAWMSVLVLFLIGIMFVLLNTRICRDRAKEQIGIFATVVIVSCIQMLYYVNRSDYVYLYTVLPTATIIMAYFIDYIISASAFSKDTFGNGILRAFATINMMILVVLCLGTVVTFLKVDARKNLNRDMTNVYVLLEEIERDIPADTIGYGVGVPELYSMLGRDAGYYGMDVAEIRFMSEENKAQICKWLNEVEDIFINVESIDKWILPFVEEGALDEFYANHEAVKSYQLNEQNYTYYKYR